jgi:ATP-dependent DNA helicase RecG
MGKNGKETQGFEKKSLRKLSFDFNGNFKDSENDRENLARHCVAFANAQGGTLVIGIEDKENLPPLDQVITDLELPNKLRRRIGTLTENVSAPRAEIKKYSNGGEAIEITILPSLSNIASTSDGKYFIRISDNSIPLLPNELSRLLTDKPSFIWETRQTKVPKGRVDEDKLQQFVSEIRSSQKVSINVKQKSDEEILEHYFFVSGDFLTNLGVLWVGYRNDRGNLSYCPTIHFIKFDESGEKVNKITWDDYYLNPKELLAAVLTQVPDWNEGVEIPQGMTRKFVPNYSVVVLRELLVNALIHRPYTQRGEVTIHLYPDHLEIRNPGRFPMGVTTENFLHKSERRNEKMAKVFSDLALMEAEGSGIDKVYESLLSSGKSLPEVFEGDDFVSIKIEKRILKKEVIGLMEQANKEFKLSAKELISLGLVAGSGSISALEFQSKLELDYSPSKNPTRQWLGSLMDIDLIKSKGKTKAVEYFVNPDFLKKSKFAGKTSLRKIEDHRLEELIYQDIKIYQPTGIGDIHKRIGEEISKNKIQKTLKKMCGRNVLLSQGFLKTTKYFIRQN